MSRGQLITVIWIALWAFVPNAHAQSPAELADLTTRIDYAFYSEQPRILDAARDALGHLKPDDAQIEYMAAYAAMRSGQLQIRSNGSAEHELDQCIRNAEHAGADSRWEAEAAILVAACSDLAATLKPLARLLHDRRRDQALARAIRAASGNPRLVLVQAWVVGNRSETGESGVQAKMIATLEHALDAFAQYRPPPAAPQWGEAEASARLGELYMARGQARRARDMIERALLLAPDYAYALRLQARLPRAP